MSSVSVVVAHRGRITVRVQPSTSMQQVLDEVCAKAGVDPNKHILMHGRKAVDLSAVFRFSGLQPNATLDLAERPAAAQGGALTVVFQIGGTRHKIQPDPNTSLASALLPLADALRAAKSEAGFTAEPSGALLDNIAIVYLTTEIPAEQLATTTLRALGLTSGNVLLRVVAKAGAFVEAPQPSSSPLSPTLPVTQPPLAAPATQASLSESPASAMAYPTTTITTTQALPPSSLSSNPTLTTAAPSATPTQATTTIAAATSTHPPQPPAPSSLPTTTTIATTTQAPSLAPARAPPLMSLLSGGTLGDAVGVTLGAHASTVNWEWDSARQRPALPQSTPPDVLLPGFDLTPTPSLQPAMPQRPFRFADYESTPPLTAAAAATASARPSREPLISTPRAGAAAHTAAGVGVNAGVGGAGTHASVDDGLKRKALGVADGDVLNVPCDRQQLLFRREEVAGERPELDMPDEFYALTVDDLNMQLRDLRSKIERDDPLTTQALREKQRQEREEAYSHCVIRLYLPDGLVMQSRFSAREPVQALFDHVRGQLQDSKIQFSLYTTPPKKELDPSLTFARAGLCPCSNVRMGLGDVAPTLLPQVLETVTTITRAEEVAESARPTPAAAAATRSSSDAPRNVDEKLLRLLKLAKKPR